MSKADVERSLDRHLGTSEAGPVPDRRLKRTKPYKAAVTSPPTPQHLSLNEREVKLIFVSRADEIEMMAKYFDGRRGNGEQATPVRDAA